MDTLQENFNSLKHCHATIKTRFTELLINELIDTKYSTINSDLIIKKNEFLQDTLRVYFDILNQKLESILKIESLYSQFTQQSGELNQLLESILNNTFQNLNQLNISWDNELDIAPIQRFLIVQDKIPFNFLINENFITREKYSKLSDPEFIGIKQEFNSLLKEKDNKNLLSLGISYSYGNIILPKTYDIIFDTRNLKNYWEQKTIVKYAFNYKNYFHTDLWKGHHSHCLIEIIGDIPKIFNELPINDGGRTLHKGIGLCTKYDWQYIRKKEMNNCA